jgi:predicted O-methyltransferase YrrM
VHNDPQLIVERLIRDKQTWDSEGHALEVTGTISLAEAQYIHDLIVENDFKICLETGVAYGASTIAICSGLAAVAARGAAVRHYGVDPCQYQTYGGAAIAALRECGLDHIIELCEGQSHVVLPKLMERGITIDFALIDGMHTFDYTLIDLFFSDKLLRPGGIMCVHDMDLPSKKKAVNYLTRYRQYRRIDAPKKPLAARLGSSLKEIMKLAPGKSLNHVTTLEPMIALQKITAEEPPWDFYARV